MTFQRVDGGGGGLSIVGVFGGESLVLEELLQVLVTFNCLLGWLSLPVPMPPELELLLHINEIRGCRVMQVQVTKYLPWLAGELGLGAQQSIGLGRDICWCLDIKAPIINLLPFVAPSPAQATAGKAA